MNEVVTKSYFQQRQRNRLYETVIKAVEASGMRQRDIAAKLNVSPSQISHFLSGPANWTIDNVSDVLFAIDAELDFSVVKFKDRKKGNRYHALNEILPQNPAISA
jgi:predicted XRE-type DNA-binding protein